MNPSYTGNLFRLWIDNGRRAYRLQATWVLALVDNQAIIAIEIDWRFVLYLVGIERLHQLLTSFKLASYGNSPADLAAFRVRS